jgi:hypothetical protein
VATEGRRIANVLQLMLFKVLAAVPVKIQVFWDVMLFPITNTYRAFDGLQSVYLQGQAETTDHTLPDDRT